MKEMMIATKNKGKVTDFKKLFSRYDIDVKSLLDFEIADIEETGSSFEENAKLKAEEIASLMNMPVLADDSGLAIDALDGRPGVYSARYAGEPTNDRQNYEKVLEELTDTNRAERTARFVCVLAMAIPGEKTIFKEGICEGTIAEEPKGENGFGYDPIFIPNGYEKTMAELDDDVKNSISHRFHALKKIEKWLETRN